MLRPPTSPTHSIAAAGARQKAGQGGIYRKSDSKLLLVNTSGSGVTSVLRATVEVPSSRVRVAFGVSGKSLYLPNSDVSGDTSSGTLASGSAVWNAVAAMKVPNSYNAPDDGADQRPQLSARPIFWMTPPNLGVTGQPEVAAPYYEAQGPGAAHTIPGVQYFANYLPDNVLQTYRVGRLIPDAYEALSAVNLYEIYVWCNTTGGDVPIQVWADWEIVDPRDEEDSQALLNHCTLSAPPTIKL